MFYLTMHSTHFIYGYMASGELDQHFGCFGHYNYNTTHRVMNQTKHILNDVSLDSYCLGERDVAPW